MVLMLLLPLVPELELTGVPVLVRVLHKHPSDEASRKQRIESIL